MASSSTSVIPLPNEILSLVADGLRHSDLYHCQLVCRGWHTVFRLALYRSVDTDLDPSALVRTRIPFEYVRHLRWHPRSSSNSEEDITRLLDKTRLLQTLHMPYPRVFRHMNVTSRALSHLQQLTLDDVPGFSVVMPLLSSLATLRRLSLSCLSPGGGTLALADLDAIIRYAPDLSDLDVQSRILLCSNPGRPLPLSVHRKLRSFRIGFHWPADPSPDRSGGGAAPWLFYLSRAFPALQHLTLSGHRSHGSQLLPPTDANRVAIADDGHFLACNALSRLSGLTEVRLIHLHDFIHPDLYPLLVRNKQSVQLIGATGGKNDGAWLARTLTSLQSHTRHLSMTLVYPRALCSSALLQHLPLTSLSIGRTAGFCSHRGHWQLPLDDVLTHAPHLVQLAFHQVTLSSAVSSVPAIGHGLKRLRLRHVVLTSAILDQCGRRCLSLQTLEMTGCKWMDPLDQAGRIPFSPDHRFQIVDIQDSGHLYNLQPYQLLKIHEDWILAAIGNSPKQQHAIGPDDFGERPGSLQTWKEIKTWRKQQTQWSCVDPEVGLSQDVACHGYLAIQCHSVDQLYFNGSNRIGLAPPSSTLSRIPFPP